MASSQLSKEPQSLKGTIQDSTMVTSVGWFFSPLWSPRANARRWVLGGKGAENDRLSAWLDDHSDFTRAYFSRRSSAANGPQAEMAPQQPRDMPRSSSDILLTTHRRRASSPLPSLCPQTSSSTRDRPEPLASTLHAPDTEAPCCRSTRSPVSSRPPLSPNGLCTPRSSRSPRPRCPSRPSSRGGPACGRGEDCPWMTGLLSGGLNQTSSVVELCQGALLHAGALVGAEYSSLSLIKKDRYGGSSLEEVVPVSNLGKGDDSNSLAHLEMLRGIMGYVSAAGCPLNIRDACEVSRVHDHEDQSPVFKLNSVLSVPIKNHREEVVGVAVMINKKSVEGAVPVFTSLDEKVLSNHMGLLGMVLDNTLLYESSRQEAKRSQAMMEMARLLSEKHRSFEILLSKMAATIMPFTYAQYCTIFISKEEAKHSFCRVIHMECEELGPACQIYRRENDISDVDQAYALRTLNTMETLNLSDSIQDPVRSLICCPVRNERSDRIIAVCQLRNKLDRDSDEPEPFNAYDERLLEDLALYCGLALQYVQSVEITEKRRASIEVTQEVLAYHITAAEDEVQALQEATIPSAESLCVLHFHFSDLQLPEEATTQATIRMFLDLKLVQHFNMDYKSLCRWVLSVRRGYRHNVPYHNWRHGLSTAQCMFAMLMTTDQFQANFSRLEILALMIATLNHDLDHRGVSNSYIQKSHQPLAQLYGHSSLENHHYNLCLFILNNSGSQILNGLSKKDYKAILPMIKRAILATDLSVYLGRRGELFSLAKKGAVSWKNEKQRDLLRSMLMTASDISAITKPWPEQKRIANLVSTEFFAQGDKEKEEFKTEPIDVMNREKSTRLPHIQVEYIDGICHPLYKALSGLFKTFCPLLKGCEENRENWQHLADGGQENGQEENEE